MTLSSLFILTAILFALSFELAGRKWGIAAIPTLPRQRRVMIGAMKKHLPALPHPRERDPALNITELGCGWGGLIAGIHKHNPDAWIIGYEVYMPAALCARIRFSRKRKIEIRKQDFFTADLSCADVIVCYLSHDLMRRLQQKLTVELKSGAIVISNAFPLPDWTPIDHIITQGIVPLHVWIYRKN